ncbi:hypothetical protein DFH06DRAFT_1128694 [Mycena polygramma]|nr:hypothetical protein DFH06DRAFT_1128694 [Mycena polygramma]
MYHVRLFCWVGHGFKDQTVTDFGNSTLNIRTRGSNPVSRDAGSVITPSAGGVSRPVWLTRLESPGAGSIRGWDKDRKKKDGSLPLGYGESNPSLPAAPGRAHRVRLLDLHPSVMRLNKSDTTVDLHARKRARGQLSNSSQRFAVKNGVHLQETSHYKPETRIESTSGSRYMEIRGRVRRRVGQQKANKNAEREESGRKRVIY